MHVQIIFPDDGWVLTELAHPLIDRLPYVTGFARSPERKRRWDIAYYINYLMFYDKVSGVERLLTGKDHKLSQRPEKVRLCGGFFTHRGDARFDQVANLMDFCVSPCTRYRDYLLGMGHRRVQVIHHGIDLERFEPKLRIGFIGKLQSGGRKGEQLLREVAALPYVELVTTEGKLPAEAIPALYRQIDYVLITSTIEGGPLCLQEGLASGKEVISTDVGMVSDLAGAPGLHIYRSREELLQLLEDKIAERRALRASVERYSIDYWVEEHDRLFHALAAGEPQLA